MFPLYTSVLNFELFLIRWSLFNYLKYALFKDVLQYIFGINGGVVLEKKKLRHTSYLHYFILVFALKKLAFYLKN